MFNPFAAVAGATGEAAGAKPAPAKPAETDLEEMQRRLSAMQEQINGLTRKE